MSTVKFINEVI